VLDYLKKVTTTRNEFAAISKSLKALSILTRRSRSTLDSQRKASEPVAVPKDITHYPAIGKNGYEQKEFLTRAQVGVAE